MSNADDEKRKLFSNLSASAPTSFDILRNQLLEQMVRSRNNQNLSTLLQQISQACTTRQLDTASNAISSHPVHSSIIPATDHTLDVPNFVSSSQNIKGRNHSDPAIDTQLAYTSDLARVAGLSKTDLLLYRQLQQQLENQSLQNPFGLANLLTTIPPRSDDSKTNELINTQLCQESIERQKEEILTKILLKSPSAILSSPTVAALDYSGAVSPAKRKFEFVNQAAFHRGEGNIEQANVARLSDLPGQNDQKLPASLQDLTGILSRVVGQLIQHQGQNIRSVACTSATVHPDKRPIVKQSPLSREQLSHLTESSELVCGDVCGDVPDSLFVSMAQMKPCKLEPEDLQGKCKNRILGSPGICCKYCGGNSGSGRYFPSTLDSFLNGTNAEKIVEHAGYICQQSPPALRLLIQNMHKWDEAHTIRKPYGSRKRFFAYAWSKFNDDPAPTKKKRRIST